MSVFEDRQLLTPFGPAICWERIDDSDMSFWICWIKETQICFWFTNQEVRFSTDWSDGRYKPLPFNLDPERIAALGPLGRHHTYWREHIAVSLHHHGEV